IGTAEASTGAAAIGRLHSEPLPDAIIIDLRLPDCHGTDVMRRLQQDPSTARIPVIVLSASVTTADRDAAAAAGAGAFLLKPVLPEELLTVVRGLLTIEKE